MTRRYKVEAMKLSTAEEIRAAHQSVESEGPGVRTTIELGALPLRDPIVKRFIESLLHPLASNVSRLHMQSLITGAVVGLKLGIRIGEALAATRGNAG